jgi:arabinosyltransferase C
LFALAIAPPGTRYIGFQYNTDDHMVYAAWMRQAMDGHFLMDNRFAVDPQPGLTIHIYFFLLGLLAKVTGIPWAAAIARFVFGGLFVLLLAKFLRLVTSNETIQKLALVIGCFGAGIGFLAWQPLGVDFLGSSQSPLKGILLGHLPNDVWQPEAFVFPSLLTNSLFSVSLCLIIGIFYCVLRARDSWRPVLPGALGMLLLMNIHSYDVLTITLVLVGLLVTAIAQKQLTAQWLIRVVVIGLGAIPAALWFIYVLQHDQVFRMRADTLTYTENFRSIFGGYCLLMLVAATGFIVWLGQLKVDPNATQLKMRFGQTFLAILALISSLAAYSASAPGNGYWLTMAIWLLVYALGLVLVGFFRTRNSALNLVLSWALLGLIIPYFPGLFQRKLMMGLSVPWAILAGIGLCYAVQKLKANEKKLVAALCIIALSGTSIFWLQREFSMIMANDSNTTLEPVFLSQDTSKIIDYLNDHSGGKRTVVLAMPGIPASLEQLASPVLPDLNPILSGFTGVYTYAGHWSETPDYNKRRGNASMLFVAQPKHGQPMSLDQRIAFAKQWHIDYIVAPVPEAFFNRTKIPLNDVRDMGDVVVDGQELRLIKLKN